MFYQLHSLIEIILLAIGLIIFAAVAWRRLDWGALMVLFLAPIYLLKIKIGWLPLNALELLIWVLAGVWAVKKVYAFFPEFSKKGFAVMPNPSVALRPGLFRDLKIKGIDGQKRVGPDGGRDFLIPIFLILLGVILSTIFSSDLKVSAGLLKSYFLAPLVFAWILHDVIKTKEQFNKIIWAMVLSGATVAWVGLFYRLAGFLTFDGRLSAFYSSPNQLAMFLAPGLLLGIGLWLTVHKKWCRAFVVFCLLLIVGCLYFTYSYAAWLAVLGAMLFLWRYRPGATYKKLLVVILCLLVVLTLLFFSQFQSRKMDDLLKFDRSSIQSRLMIWQAAEEILKDNWFLGIGPGMFQTKYLAYQSRFPAPYLEWSAPQPHNIFLAFWLEAGLIGLVGLVWLAILFFKQIYFLYAKKQPAQNALFGDMSELLISSLAAVMLYILLHGLVDTTYWRNDLALIFWSIVVLSCKASRLFY